MSWADQLGSGLTQAWEASKPYLPEAAGAALGGGAAYLASDGDPRKALAGALVGGTGMHLAKDPLQRWLFPPTDVPNMKLGPYMPVSIHSDDPVKYGDPGRTYLTGPHGTHMVPLPADWRAQSEAHSPQDDLAWFKDFYEKHRP